MSLADAQADIESALEALMESGEKAIFSYKTDPVFDDDTGDLISGGTSGAQIAYGYPESYSNSEIDGTNIQRGDIKLICSAGALRPVVGWLCLLDSVSYRVMSCDSIRESGVDVIYYVQLRK
jgi:hypothetical protein